MLGIRRTEGLPELGIFLSLLHYNMVTSCGLLMLLEKGNVLDCSLLVDSLVLWQYLGSLPEVQFIFTLNYEH